MVVWLLHAGWPSAKYWCSVCSKYNNYLIPNQKYHDQFDETLFVIATHGSTTMRKLFFLV